MSVHGHTLQPGFSTWVAPRPRWIRKKLIKRLVKLAVILLLALIIFLTATVPVIAAPVSADPLSEQGANTYTYVVQANDTLTSIALRHGVKTNALKAANDLPWNGWVYARQALIIPGLEGALANDDRGLPDPLPSLPVQVQAPPDSVVPFTYARVIQDDAPVYSSPEDVILGTEPKRRLGSGYIWVSVQGRTTMGEREFYQINGDEYVLAEDLSFYRPSTFRGVALVAQPERPFAWILTPVQPLLQPGGEVNPDASLYKRYDLVQIFATERLGEGVDQVWYLIGPDQWINQTTVGKVTLAVRPEGVGPEAAWIDVDLFEQTLAAYVGDQMIYATLISSGLPGWDTPAGLNQVWLKVKVGKMSGAYNRPDYYFLEDVPWTMYFNKDVALHTAYWHDGFGYKHSHGCVNMTPLDAQWLFEWAPESVWVWVH